MFQSIQMYKVFYNEKAVILSDSPLPEIKNLKFSTNSQFEEALALLRNTSAAEINIYHHNLDKLWQHFKSYFDYLEAAGGVVENQKNEILFIYRLGKWDLPKGKVEKGETTEVAAVREVMEECGIEGLKLGELICNTYHIYFLKNMKLKAIYWYRMTTDDPEIPVPQNEEGIEIAVWKPVSEIPTLMNQTYENIKIVIDSYFTSNQTV